MQFSDFQINQNWNDDIKLNYEKYYREIWEDKEYFRHGLEIKEGDVVLDLGASIGLFSLLALEKKAKRIISIESNNEVYQYLKENCKKYKKITPVNEFVCHRDVKVTGKNGFIETIDLKYIIEKFKLSKIDFLKLDIEGFEFAFVLNELDENIKMVRQWAIEVHTCGLFCDKTKECEFAIGMVDKFAKLGYECILEKLHLETCCYMIYAKK
jgi:hypothetical protein